MSNFLADDLDNIIEHGSIAPDVNQILVHAGNTPAELISYCENKGILIEAYSTIAHGKILNNPAVAAIAEQYGVSVPQLCIRYTIQLDTVSLPKTANPDHIRTNADIDFTITDGDMDALRNLDERDYGEHATFPVYSGK